ncbi:mitochondrial inner membrane protease subunit 2 isoform X2 [Eurytemora carolleeae]|nr:mitochondrial inner membrane protease subunit 2 isoform X2 [Eurytemora carolleeae]|eukprot:XP_023319568.1 mitochondrial inner membrane protease subunit 2-like isoform X2 [Eurytemora affinis]
MISFVGYPAYITGKSMQPEFNAPAENKERENAISSWKNIFFRLDLDWIWVSCWRARNFGFDRGDIVVYVSPKEPYDYVIKRVVGLEGDIVTNQKRQIKVKIPPGHCWVEGDNKSNSVDSNYYGPISKGLIFGVASHVIWPSHKWRKLESGLTPSLLSRVELQEQSPKPRSWLQHFKIIFYFLQTGTRGSG